MHDLVQDVQSFLMIWLDEAFRDEVSGCCTDAINRVMT